MFQLKEIWILDHPVEHFIEFIKHTAIPWKFLDYELADGGEFQYKIEDRVIVLRYIPKTLSKYYNKPYSTRFRAYILIKYLENNSKLEIAIQNDSITEIDVFCGLFLITCFGIGIIALFMNHQIDLIGLVIFIFFMIVLVFYVVSARKNIYTTKQQFDLFMEAYKNHD